MSKARFDEIFRSGKRVSVGPTRLMSLPGAGLIGYATSRKLGCIARRNRLKRRLREAVRAAGDNLQGYDYVLSVGPGAEQAPFLELRSAVRALFLKMSKRWESESECS